jgi:FixJ family two-component response regulator
MKIAIVDDEHDMRQSISQWLALSGFETATFASAEEALKSIGADWPGVVVSDVRMPGMDGMAFLKRLMGIDSGLPVIMITGHGDVPMAVEAMRVGAFDFLEKPFNPDRMTDLAKRAGQQRRLTLDNRALRRELSDGSALMKKLIGASPVMERLKEDILDLGQADGHVLQQLQAALVAAPSVVRQRHHADVEIENIRRFGRRVPGPESHPHPAERQLFENPGVAGNHLELEIVQASEVPEWLGQVSQVFDVAGGTHPADHGTPGRRRGLRSERSRAIGFGVDAGRDDHHPGMGGFGPLCQQPIADDDQVGQFQQPSELFRKFQEHAVVDVEHQGAGRGSQRRFEIPSRVVEQFPLQDHRVEPAPSGTPDVDPAAGPF